MYLIFNDTQCIQTPPNAYQPQLLSCRHLLPWVSTLVPSSDINFFKIPLCYSFELEFGCRLVTHVYSISWESLNHCESNKRCCVMFGCARAPTFLTCLFLYFPVYCLTFVVLFELLISLQTDFGLSAIWINFFPASQRRYFATWALMLEGGRHFTDDWWIRMNAKKALNTICASKHWKVLLKLYAAPQKQQ